jgi:hypothetical protein
MFFLSLEDCLFVRSQLEHRTHQINRKRLLTQARAAERRMEAQAAAKRASLGALGGAHFRDSSSIGGGSNGS